MSVEYCTVGLVKLAQFGINEVHPSFQHSIYLSHDECKTDEGNTYIYVNLCRLRCNSHAETVKLCGWGMRLAVRSAALGPRTPPTWGLLFASRLTLASRLFVQSDSCVYLNVCRAHTSLMYRHTHTRRTHGGRPSVKCRSRSSAWS